MEVDNCEWFGGPRADSVNTTLNGQTLLPGLDKWAWVRSCTDAFSVDMFRQVIEDAWFPIEDYIHKWCKWVPIKIRSIDRVHQNASDFVV
ncbi:hypothetical protein L1987_72323 [Smallanthus sonchifolius]|uniref:Uncharacterized protein n=1 Tax=Smallanthus sonchifolius TaxID=185202 RepID=A0ACB9AU24_9ASTR|nr:hypothetical protein L1987_72323 [Smallanthus sonchifolius]